MKIINVRITDKVERDPYNADFRFVALLGDKLAHNSGGGKWEHVVINRSTTDDKKRIEQYNFKLTFKNQSNIGLDIIIRVRVYFQDKTGYKIKMDLSPINTQLKISQPPVSGKMIGWENVVQTLEGWFKSYDYDLSNIIKLPIKSSISIKKEDNK